jgi:hypothetical protein
MSISLTGTFGYFTRMGVFCGEYNRVAALYGSATDVGFQSIWTQFASSDQAAVSNLPAAVATFRQTGTSYQSTLAADGQLASILQANDSSPLVPYTYSASVTAVRDQMVATGPTTAIVRPTLTSTATVGGSNLGDTKFFLSTTNIYGDPLDMTLTETFSAVCQSQGSGFQSSWGITGQPTVLPSAWNWPQGSGASVSLSAVDPAVSGIITNGDFSAFTVANTPDDWTIVNGSAGVTVFKSTSGGVRSGTDACYLLSDGSSTTKLAQDVSLSINTVYAVTFQAKMNSNSASGSLIVELTNSSGTVLTNDAGTALSATYALNGGAGEITTSYQLLTVFFSTPRQLPSTVQLRIGYNVAGVSTRQLTLDLIQVFQATPLYGASGTGTSGPWVAAVANTTASALGDTYSLAFTTTATPQTFALGLQRVFDLRSLGLYFPSNVSGTIPNNLITN